MPLESNLTLTKELLAYNIISTSDEQSRALYGPLVLDALALNSTQSNLLIWKFKSCNGFEFKEVIKKPEEIKEKVVEKEIQEVKKEEEKVVKQPTPLPSKNTPRTMKRRTES